MAQPTVSAFQNAFLASYNEARNAFTNPERWAEICHASNWNTLMLWQVNEDVLPPPEIKASVLSQTAGRLKLRYANREPLRIDAVFSESEESWFPIVVAIEHENYCSGFQSEVKKLLSVRCPLKVGITYILSSAAKRQQRLGSIADSIRNHWRKSIQVCQEDRATVYLFLLGTELSEN